MDPIPSRPAAGDFSVTHRAPLEDAPLRRHAALEDAVTTTRNEAGVGGPKCPNCDGYGHRWWNGCPLPLKPSLAAEAAAKARAKATPVVKGKGKGKDGSKDGRRTRQRF